MITKHHLSCYERKIIAVLDDVTQTGDDAIEYVAVDVQRDASPSFIVTAGVLPQALVIDPKRIVETNGIPNRRVAIVAGVNPMRNPYDVRHITEVSPIAYG